jgi:hypothetical protein
MIDNFLSRQNERRRISYTLFVRVGLSGGHVRTLRTNEAVSARLIAGGERHLAGFPSFNSDFVRAINPRITYDKACMLLCSNVVCFVKLFLVIFR